MTGLQLDAALAPSSQASGELGIQLRQLSWASLRYMGPASTKQQKKQKVVQDLEDHFKQHNKTTTNQHESVAKPSTT